MKKIKYLMLFIFLLTGGTLLYAQTPGVDEQMAAQYFRNGEFDKAAELYERLFNKTKSQLYYNYLLQSYESLENYKQAEKLIRSQIKTNPKALNYLVDLGVIYQKQGSKSKAEKQFKQAIEKLEPNQEQVNGLAKSFIENKETDFAIETYQQGRKLFAQPFAFMFQLNDLYLQKGNYDEVIKDYLALLDAQPAMMEQVQAQLQNMMERTSDERFANSLKSNLVKRTQKSPDSRLYADMMMWFSLQQKDFEFALRQAKGIDKRFPKESGFTVFRVAEIAMSNKDYDIASNAFNYLVQKGKTGTYYMNGRVGYLDAEFNKALDGFIVKPEEMKTLRTNYQQTLEELGKNENTLVLMKNFAHLLAFYGNDIQAAADVLYAALEINTRNKSLLAECKLELGDILLFGGDIWESSLLYSQVEKDFKNDAVGAAAKFRNAKLSYYNGDFEWAKTQLNVLRSSTSKLIANDAMELSLLISDNMEDDSTYTTLEYYAQADLYLYQNRYKEALLELDTIKNLIGWHSLSDEVLMKEAQIALKQNKYNQADTLLQQLVDLYPYDILADDALFMLGELYEEHFKKPQEAIKFYERILLEYTGSLYGTEARKRYNNLKKSVVE